MLRQAYPSARLPLGPVPEERQRWYQPIEEQWGGPFDVSVLAPSRVNDPSFMNWFAIYLRMGASPRAAVTLARTNTEIGVRNILPVIRVPTLLMHRRHDRGADFEEGR